MTEPNGRSGAEGSEPATQARQAAEAEPADPGWQATPAEPAGPAWPTTPAETADPTGPAWPTTPAETAHPARPAWPITPAETADPAGPAWPTTPAETAYPTGPGWSATQTGTAEHAVGSLVEATPPGPGLAPTGRRPSRARRIIAIGSLIVLGVCFVGGGAALIVRELTLHATSGQAKAAAALEVATRWQRLTAGQIFPATVQYLDGDSITQSAHRVGIAPPTSCRAGLSQSVHAAIFGLGCTLVFRATYSDQSGTLVATVGAAILPSQHAAAKAVSVLTGLKPFGGVKPVGFTGTLTDLFAGSQLAAFGTPVASGRYVFFYAAGYADGEPGSAGNNPDLTSLGQGLVAKVEQLLTSPGQPCAMKDIRC